VRATKCKFNLRVGPWTLFHELDFQSDPGKIFAGIAQAYSDTHENEETCGALLWLGQGDTALLRPEAARLDIAGFQAKSRREKSCSIPATPANSLREWRTRHQGLPEIEEEIRICTRAVDPHTCSISHQSPSMIFITSSAALASSTSSSVSQPSSPSKS
jgi:hypothetical protein